MLTAEHTVFDAIVAGAGFAGCATAIHLARQGARVLLLEPNPVQPRRFAGEWIHPPGVRQLDALGISLAGTPHARGKGFAIFFDDAQPTMLPYPRAEESLSCEHSQLMSALHARVRELPEIVFVAGARLIEIDSAGVVYRPAGSEASVRVDSPLIVGADGRASTVRSVLGAETTSPVVSHMAGVLVEDLELTIEGFAHVLVGAPGPILIYRVAERKVRICFDVPPGLLGSCRTADGLWSVYGRTLPEALRPGARLALEQGRIRWAANRVLRREFYGRGCVALVGDAVGHTHPLSACGLTMALLDAECLARTRDVCSYAHERYARSRVPELVAESLHRIIVGDDAGAVTLRRGLNRVWRNNPALSGRTMQLLTSDETGFGGFCQIVLRAISTTLYEISVSATRHGVGATARSLAGLVGWLGWLARSLWQRLAVRPRWCRTRQQRACQPVSGPATR